MDKSSKSFIKTTNQESKDIIAELNSKDVKTSIGARIMRDSTEVKKANDQSKRLGMCVNEVFFVFRNQKQLV